uniref:Protein krueppel n=1 Tax=Glossina palpalis gambiensis TaxID=67801 RepID=A0A1B0BVS4_9MUSC
MPLHVIDDYSNPNVNNSWLNWCRLCAKQQEEDAEVLNVFNKNEPANTTLATIIGKYFWVNIKKEDHISTCLCQDCYTLIEELVAFTEHVNKVQTMFYQLDTQKPVTLAEAQEVRGKCGLFDEKWQHIVHKRRSKNHYEVEDDELHYINAEEALGEEEGEEVVVEESGNMQVTELVVNEEEINVEEQNQSEEEEVYEYDMIEFKTEQEEIHETKKCLALKRKNIDEQPAVEEKEGNDSLKEFNCKNDHDIGQQQNKKLKLPFEDQHVVTSDDGILTNEKKAKNTEGEEEEYIYFDEESKSNADKSVPDDLGLLLKQRPRGRPTNSSRGYQSTYRYACETCKRKYKNPNIYRKHMETKHKVKIDQLPDFVCSVCNKDCQTESNLKKHKRQHMSTEEKLIIPCPYCGRKFSQMNAMRVHVNAIHHQLKPYICDQCGRACKTLAGLNEHQLVHTNECPFECEVCKSRFKNKARLKCHMDIHTDTAIVCPDCGLKLNTRRTYLAHRLVHSDVKRYKCEFCDAAFKRSKAFKNHLILHTGMRPYKCNFCDKTFSNGSNCRSHKKKTHPKELAELEAKGQKSLPVTVPRLEDLKSVKNVVAQPRKTKRQGEDLSNRLRTLLKSSEEKAKADETEIIEDDPDDNETSTDHYDHYEMYDAIEESEDTDNGDNFEDGEGETVVYQIIDVI